MKWNMLPICIITVLSAVFVHGEEIRYSAHRTIDLPAAVQVGPSGLKEIEIWVTDDGGVSWRKGAVRKADDGRLSYSVQSDGTYGFSIVVVSNNNERSKTPQKGTEPDMVYVVDTSDPVIDVYSSKPGRILRHGESVVIEWNIRDDNIDKKECSFMFSRDSGETWVSLAAGELTGKRTFTGSSEINPVLFRVSARDLAGRYSDRVLAFSVVPRETGPGGPGIAEKVQTVRETGEDRFPGSATETDDEETATAGTSGEEGAAQFRIISDEKDGFTDAVIQIEDSYYDGGSALSETLVGTEGVVILDRTPERKPVEQAEKESVQEPAKAVMPEQVYSRAAAALRQSVDGKAVAYCDKAVDMEVFQRLQAAETYYKSALMIEPKYYRALKGLAELYVRQDRFSDAAASYRALLGINPEDRDIRNEYAYCVLMTNDYNEAEKEFRHVLLMDPDNINAMWYLSKLYKDTNRIGNAIYLWTAIVNRGPEHNRWHGYARSYLSIYAPSYKR